MNYIKNLFSSCFHPLSSTLDPLETTFLLSDLTTTTCTTTLNTVPSTLPELPYLPLQEVFANIPLVDLFTHIPLVCRYWNGLKQDALKKRRRLYLLPSYEPSVHCTMQHLAEDVLLLLNRQSTLIELCDLDLESKFDWCYADSCSADHQLDTLPMMSGTTTTTTSLGELSSAASVDRLTKYLPNLTELTVVWKLDGTWDTDARVSGLLDNLGDLIERVGPRLRVLRLGLKVKPPQYSCRSPSARVYTNQNNHPREVRRIIIDTLDEPIRRLVSTLNQPSVLPLLRSLELSLNRLPESSLDQENESQLLLSPRLVAQLGLLIVNTPNLLRTLDCGDTTPTRLRGDGGGSVFVDRISVMWPVLMILHRDVVQAKDYGLQLQGEEGESPEPLPPPPPRAQHVRVLGLKVLCSMNAPVPAVLGRVCSHYRALTALRVDFTSNEGLYMFDSIRGVLPALTTLPHLTRLYLEGVSLTETVYDISPTTSTRTTKRRSSRTKQSSTKQPKQPILTRVRHLTLNLFHFEHDRGVVVRLQQLLRDCFPVLEQLHFDSFPCERCTPLSSEERVTCRRTIVRHLMMASPPHGLVGSACPFHPIICLRLISFANNRGGGGTTHRFTRDNETHQFQEEEECHSKGRTE